jgi:hypothetical protein
MVSACSPTFDPEPYHIGDCPVTRSEKHASGFDSIDQRTPSPSVSASDAGKQQQNAWGAAANRQEAQGKYDKEQIRRILSVK